MKKLTIYFTVLLGVLIGLFGASENFLAMLAVIAFAVFTYIIISNYETATYLLGAYSIIDFVMRTYITSFASVWDELFLVALILLWVYKWLVYRKDISFKQTPLDLPVIIYITVMLFLLIVNSPDFIISLEGFRAVIQYILWYFIILQLLRTKESAKNICIVIVIVAGILALHGVYQYIIGVEMPAGWIDSKEADLRTRVFSILGSPNILGSFMTLCAPICVSFMFFYEKKLKKCIFAVMFIIMAATLVFTFSRGAWIGFAAAIGIYVLLKDKRLIIPAIILGVMVIAFVPSVGNRITYMLSPEYIESSLRGGRLVRWLTGLEILQMYPLFGVGLGHFGGAVAMNNGLKMLVGIDVVKTFYMDNYYLKTAVETGIVGLTAFVFLMYQVFICSLRTVKITFDNKYKELEIGIMAGLVGVIVHNFVENVFEVPMMMSCFWLLAAVMMHLWYLNFNRQK